MRTAPTLLLLGIWSSISALAASDVNCVDLRCEFLTNPVGVDQDQPRFSWALESKIRGQRAIAHRILVSTTADKLAAHQGDLWDSQRVDDPVLLYHVYGSQKRTGKPLASGQEVHWKVMVWDRDNVASEWSEPAKFTMAIVDDRDWKAEWISFKDSSALPRSPKALHLPAPRYYRKEFEPAKKVKRALAFASALGIYELHLNGSKVGDAYFAPGWTDYHQRVYFNTYDVTSQLQTGKNCIGAVVADGWYAGYVGFGKRFGYGPSKTGRNIYGKTPALSVQLQIEFDDGSSETILTDSTWTVGTGPEFEADLLMGEAYDATKEIPAWATAGFDASGWANAIPAADNPSTKAFFIDQLGRKNVEIGFTRPALLDVYPAEPVRVTQELAARELTEPKPGTWIFDFGQNFAGNVRLKITGEKGQKLTLRYGEMLHLDGRLMTENLRDARATDTYICKGDPNGETWSPRFTCHGFRFAEISGLKEKPPLDTLTGLVIHNDLALTSAFECNDPVVNKIFENCVWTHRGNSIELPTTYPQRDDRLGWSSDAEVSISAASYHLDAPAFYGKWLREQQESRTPEGYFSNYAPYPFAHGKARYGTSSSDAGIICPFVLWRMYGERQVVQSRWFAIDKYMKARLQADPKLKGIKFGDFRGDWLNVDDPTPNEYIDLCYLALDVRLMMELAVITGGPIVFNTYRPVLVEILASFQKQYLNEDGSLKIKSQTAHVLALRFGLVPPEHQARVVKDLVNLIQAARSPTQSGLKTGLLGTKPLLTVLTRNGHHDEAIRLLQSRKYPSWGYEIENGATTVWERWDAFTREHGFKGIKGDQTAATNSFSHPGFAAVSEWMMSSLAGIAAADPGFEQILLEPHVPSATATDETEPINWVRAHYNSARGPIAVFWKKNEDGSLLYEVTIPANTKALLKLPAKNDATILESGVPVAEAPGVLVLEGYPEDGTKWFNLDSGSYRFEAK